MPVEPIYVQLLDELLDLHYDKSGGYGTLDDPLANFTSVAASSREPAYRYPRRRVIEKLARLESLDEQGRIDELEQEHLDVASLMLCAEALRRRALRSAGEPRDIPSSPAPHPAGKPLSPNATPSPADDSAEPRLTSSSGIPHTSQSSVGSLRSSHHPETGLSAVDPPTLFAERLRELAALVEFVRLDIQPRTSALRAARTREVVDALRAAADLIGPSALAEGPYVAPLTQNEETAVESASGGAPGHKSCKSALFRSDQADAEILSRRVEAAGRGYEGHRTA